MKLKRRWQSHTGTIVVVVVALRLVTSAAGQTVLSNLAEATAAPSPSPATSAEVERVTVTGSSLPTANEVGPNLVQVIDRSYIEQSGERTGEEFIKNLPVANANGVPTSNNANNLTAGASSISLRGFDPSETLVLIDGRRVAPYPIGARGNQTFVDLNSIPEAAVASIEILKDSASTIYGADAVAGVVNLKLLHRYNGTEASVEYGNTLDRDSGEYAASLIFGVGKGDTNLTGIVNFYHRNSIFARDRDYSATVPQAQLSTNSSPFNLQLSREAVIAAGGTPPNATTFFGHAPFLSTGNAPASAYTYTTFRSSLYNFAESAGALPDSERYGGFLNGEHKFSGDQIVAYGDFLYQNVRTHNELAPTPTGPFEQPGQTILAIPPHMPGATVGGPTYEETGVAPGAYNPFNPFQQIISGSSRGRLAEFGNRLLSNETDAYLATLGLKGNKLGDSSWGYDVAGRWSKVENTGRDTFVSASRFNRILNAADPIFDPSSSNYIGTTIPYNPFGDYRRPIPSNTIPVDFATVHTEEVDTSTLFTFDFNVYTTELFQLPAGGFALALGGQYRGEAIEQRPDKLNLAGDLLSFSSPASFTSASRNSYGLYAEANIPIFGPAFAIPGFHRLELSAAVRYEDFVTSSNNVMVPKFGLLWQPFDESLTLRSTWGEGFREPSLMELFSSPQQFLFTNGELVEVPITLRSNPTLQPEDSRAFTAGIVYTPKFVPELTVTVDLWDIESKGRVTTFSDPALVIERANNHDSLFGEVVHRDASGEIVSIEEAFQNGGSQKARGIDFALLYQRSTRLGTLTSITEATYLDSFQFAETPDVPEQELRSSSQNGSFDAYLKWKATSRLTWSWRGFDLAITARYRDGFHEPNFATGGEHYVRQTWFFDVQASYDFRLVSEEAGVAGYAKAGDDSKTLQTVSYSRPIWQQLLHGTRFTVGCNNVFDHDPPRTFGGYAGFLYDPTGRFVYVRLRKQF